MTRLTVTPAYGRDYSTAKAARAAWADGKDWIVADYQSPWDGKPINASDARSAGIIEVTLRFGGLRKIAIVKVGA